MKFTKAIVLLLASSPGAIGHPGKGAEGEPCPFLEQDRQDEVQRRLGQGWKMPPMRSLAERTGDGGIPEGGFDAVRQDLKDLFTDSQDFWPADFADTPSGPHYGGLFIRLAWHCSGSYRQTDGRGGCDGGRIRFDPELNWEDNANLDMALKLLQPIKDKYGSSLSWGDLIILSGTTAIEDMGGPSLGFCGGRIDDADGSDSLRLGPSPEQEEIAPCLTVDRQGDCLSVEGSALGPTTVGLIYVNPAGPEGATGDAVASGADVRRAFANMGFDDRETVSLIGGGHAFGKAHGPCPDPPCGNGLGNNVTTSGFEGAWTTTPTIWTNQYFTNLFDFTWNAITGPGGNLQWEPTNAERLEGPDIFMLTADIAMSVDEDYEPISREYGNNLAVLEEDFAKSWYRLTSQDIGPRVRCIGDDIPEPQFWQYPLPDSPSTLPDYVPVRAAIQTLIDADETNADAFINLAFNCAATFRSTDYRGGCNGARIRFPPENEWDPNTNDAIAMLGSIESSDISYADKIVLAGITALESKTDGLDLAFCGGYVDAEDADGSEQLAPRTYNTPLITITDDALVKGLSKEQFTALASRTNVSSQWYKDLMAGNGNFSEQERALLEGGFAPIVESFANDEDKLRMYFSEAWNKMMTADRLKNNRENACKGVNVSTLATPDSGATAASTLVALAAALAAIMAI